ncbi:phosphoribosylamine--glycine ligase [Lamprobacter modestohalophilus]|uniref:phosphoribosylamine--glycine ligase n=1 Tax=Lamprobacter modestohalophilus TaxID=1064514 RepID=UPI002ADEE143|nr:phosphoribosylamine--glycine ligase [Lamprobacter modestohalophilus]MEA1051644.1 phosphoribosylamine--glycine ligase [Lamprobacter modestohalophilus]
MNILIIGSGGREHALAWKIAQSPKVSRVFVAPGNGGTATEAGVDNVDLDPTDAAGLIEFAKDHQIELCIIGPEAPLVAGVSDALVAAGLPCCGPSQRAAQLEGSKDFAKAFMQRHDIPTAAYRTFSDREQALAYLDQVGAPVVVKADGLAAGKGVVVAEDLDEARAAVDAMLGQGRFGSAGHRVVIEEKLLGEEVSFIVLVSGEQVLPLATSQDHKARDEGDRGPNTGGMGAYSPAPIVTPELEQRIMREVIEPTVAGLRAEDLPYVGFLYAGLMIGADGTPRVLEYNCRLGDPETQPILMRLESDLLELCLAATEGRLAEVDAQWCDQAALGVVMAAGGYPGDYAKGHPISGLESALDDDSSKAETSSASTGASMVLGIGMGMGMGMGMGTPSTGMNMGSGTGGSEAKVFHAGTKRDGERTLTNGGRVLCVTALGADVGAAAAKAYALAERIQFEGAFYRRDIGYRALKHGTTR